VAARLLAEAVGVGAAPPAPDPALPGLRQGAQGLGLYSGGTLKSEAAWLLGPVSDRVELLDLGDDRYTRGRPHPMIDQHYRAERIRKAAEGVHLILIDLVLGRGSHPDPASALAQPIGDFLAGAQPGAPRLVLAAVVGTEEDPQRRSLQVERLRGAGAVVAASHAQAARLARRALERSGA
jgi:FdrA protein